MSFNLIEILHENLFDNLENLKFLNLSYNKFENINLKILNCLKNLEQIDIYSRKKSLIEESSKRMFKKLIKVNYNECSVSINDF